MAAPTIRNTTSASNAGGSLAVTKPSGLAVGDYLIAWHISDNDGALASMGAPSGWTLLGSSAGQSGGHPYQKVWTKVATSTETAASTFTFTDSASGIHNSVVCMAITTGTYDSASPTTTVTFNNGGTSSSTSHVAPSVTGVVDGLLVTSHGSDTGGTAATYTAPSGMTERADTNGGSGSYTALSVATLALASTSATGTKTATCTTSRPWKGSTLIVNPATGGGGGGTGATRINLVPNPALKNNATDWTGPSGWARSTSVDAGLPRTTGFEGTTAGDVLTPRAQVVAGSQYYWAIWVKANVDQSANMLVNYYDAASGGNFVANSGPTVPLTLTSGNVSRFVLGPYTVPAGAVSGYLKLNDLDGAAELTGYQVEAAATFGAYFDGDTTGATWDGTSGNSTSTLRQSADSVTVAENFSKQESIPADGKLATDTAAVAESWSISATGSAIAESARIADSFLITTLEFDEIRGRNRVSAFTWAADVTSVRVSRRRVGGGAWELVRGGAVDVVAGFMARVVDDYEFPSGVDLDYRLEGITTTGTVAQTATVRRTSTADSVWLKFITSPALNRRLEFMGRGEVTRQSRTAVYDVQGRSDPVVVSDVHGSRRMTIRAKAETPAEAAALDHSLRTGLPCYLQVPESINTPSIYAVVGDYSSEAPALRSMRSVFSISLIEVAAPPPSIVSPHATWAQLLVDYSTWESVIAAVPTWLGIAD